MAGDSRYGSGVEQLMWCRNQNKGPSIREDAVVMHYDLVQQHQNQCFNTVWLGVQTHKHIQMVCFCFASRCFYPSNCGNFFPLHIFSLFALWSKHLKLMLSSNEQRGQVTVVEGTVTLNLEPCTSEVKSSFSLKFKLEDIIRIELLSL